MLDYVAKGVLKFNVQKVLPLKEAAQVRVIDGCLYRLSRLLYYPALKPTNLHH